MGNPTLDKTWQYSTNINLLTDTDPEVRYRRLIRTIKDTLIGFSSNPWTVFYSCDSVTAGTAGDGVDRWIDDGDLVESATTRSWIVLKQTNILSNFQICWDLNNSNVYNATIVISPSAGFTGGATTARPTATDEIVITTTNWGVGDILNDFSSIMPHIMMSDDGEVTRIFFVVITSPTYGPTCSGLLTFEKPKNPLSGWTDPWISIVSLSSGVNPNGATTYATLREQSVTSNNKVYSVLPNGPTTHKLYMSSEGCTGDSGNEYLGGRSTGFNQISQEWEFYSIGLVCHDSPNRGRHGEIYDMWFCPSSLNTGDTFPEDGTKQFVVVENILLPWNGGIFKV